MRDKKAAIGLACQLAFEYDPCGDEEISDMYQTYRDCGDKPPCSADELQDLTYEALALKRENKGPEAAEKLLLEKHSRKKKTS